MSRRHKKPSVKKNDSKQDGSKDVHSSVPDFPYKEVFLEFQQELDTKHDKHERLVKLSRDCTIRSKRVIFLLHRPSGSESSMDAVLTEAEEKITKEILPLLCSIATELLGVDPKKHHYAYNPGLQEFIEALSYLVFLKNGRLIKLEEVQSFLTFEIETEEANQKDKGVPQVESLTLSEDGSEVRVAKRQCLEQDKEQLSVETIKLHLDPIDYVLGIADLTGELMRLCINCVGCGDKDLPFRLLSFLRAVYCGFLSLRPNNKEMGRKISTLKTSLLKVENVCYTLKIRGSEVPEHMLVDMITTKGAQDNNTGGLEVDQ